MDLPIDMMAVLEGLLSFAYSAMVLFGVGVALFVGARLLERLLGPIWRRYYRYSREWTEFDTAGKVQLLDGTLYDGTVMARCYKGQIQYRKMTAREEEQHHEEFLSKNAW